MPEGTTGAGRKGRAGGGKGASAGAGDAERKAAPRGGAARGTRAKGGAAKRSAGAAAATPASPARTARPRRSAKSRANEELASSYFAALAARDVESAGSYWSPDGIADIVPLAMLRGSEEVKALFRELFAAVPDSEFSAQRILADDARAAVEWRLTGSFTGAPFQGIEPTGRGVELRGLDLLEVEEGKIVRTTAYYDGMAFARQVGMLPEQDSGADRAMKGAFNAVTRLRKAVGERMGSR